MRLALVTVLVLFAVSCTTTQFAAIPPLTPSVFPAPDEFNLHVGVYKIPPDAVLELVFEATYRTTDKNGSLAEQKPISGSCISRDGTPFSCDEAGKPITQPCIIDFKTFPLPPDGEGKWKADLRVGLDDGVCRCARNHCRGKLKMFLRDKASDQPLPGPHTAMTIQWHESGDANLQVLTWNN